MATNLLKIKYWDRTYVRQVFAVRLFNSELWPAIEAQLRSFRLAEGQKLDPLRLWIAQDLGWINPEFPIPFDETLYPGIAQLRADRTAVRNLRVPAGQTEPDWIGAQAPVTFDIRFVAGTRIPDQRSTSRKSLDVLLLPARIPSGVPQIQLYRVGTEQQFGSFRFSKTSKPIPAGEYQTGWITFGTSAFPLTSQIWPGIEEPLRSSRMATQARAIPEGQIPPDWLAAATVPLPEFWKALDQLSASQHTPKRPAGLLVGEFDLGWIQTAATLVTVPEFRPTVEQPLPFPHRPRQAYLAIPSGDFDLGWITANTPALFDEANWGAIDELKSFRSEGSKRLDVRGNEWSLWPSPTVGAAAFPLGEICRLLTEAGDPILTEDGFYLSTECEDSNAYIWPSIDRSSHSFRLPDRPRLRVTDHEWTQLSWAAVPAAAFPLDAPLWPGIEQIGHSFSLRKRAVAIAEGETRFDLGILGAGGFPLPAELWPGIEPHTERTPSRPSAIPRGQLDQDWIGFNTPPTVYDPAVKMPWGMGYVPTNIRRPTRTDVFASGFQDGWIAPHKRKMTASGVMGKSKYMAGYGVAPHPFGV